MVCMVIIFFFQAEAAIEMVRGFVGTGNGIKGNNWGTTPTPADASFLPARAGPGSFKTLALPEKRKVVISGGCLTFKTKIKYP